MSEFEYTNTATEVPLQAESMYVLDLLTDEQRSRQPLLFKGIILLVGDIDENAYVELSWALAAGRELFCDRPLILRINSTGGMSTPAFGMADLIREDGNVWGVAYGPISSSAALVWASCARRYVGQSAMMGVHSVWSEMAGTFDAHSSKGYLDEFTALDWSMASIFGSASNQPTAWWKNKIAEGERYVVWLDYHDLTATLDMAFPLNRLQGDLAAFAPTTVEQ